MTKDEFLDICADVAEEHFPKGRCKERGELLVFISMLYIKLRDKWILS